MICGGGYDDNGDHDDAYADDGTDADDDAVGMGGGDITARPERVCTRSH